MSACKEAGCSLPTISSCSSQPYFVVPARASTAAWRQSTVEEAMEPIPFWMLPSSCSDGVQGGRLHQGSWIVPSVHSDAFTAAPPAC